MNICPWRDASRPLEIFGIPVVLLPIYCLWFEWVSWTTLYICTALIIFFKILSLFGFTITVLWQRLIHLMRGTEISGRPWWYRKFFE
ncbi:conjugal transfer protein [Salmonella enterica subsp. enterica]|nr:conjugal transfer protein [Salmonella enterica subsp. enterica serovar Mikawasima]EDN7229284.1 conjugal transfer protein [Salmonella enterica subsp. enterica serovar Mikawasima]